MSEDGTETDDEPRLVETIDDGYIAADDDDGDRWVDETADRPTYAFEMATDDGTATVEVASPADEERVGVFGRLVQDYVQARDDGPVERRPRAIEVPKSAVVGRREAGDDPNFLRERGGLTGRRWGDLHADLGPSATLMGRYGDGDPVEWLDDRTDHLPGDPPYALGLVGALPDEGRAETAGVVMLAEMELVDGGADEGPVDRETAAEFWRDLKESDVSEAVEAGDAGSVADALADLLGRDDRLPVVEVSAGEARERGDGVEV